MSLNKSEEEGLSSNNRNLLTIISLVILLLWGPVAPYGLVVRIIYLAVLPTSVWFILGYLGGKWKADESANNRLARGVAGIIAGALFIGAYLAFTAHYHTQCTQSVQTRDGSECVGDYVTVPGRDLTGTFIFTALGIIAAWYSISNHDDTSDK